MGYTFYGKYAAVQMMIAVAVFAMPLASCIIMGTDQYTTLWIGRFPLAALLVVPLIGAVYFVQRNRAPSHVLACVMAIAPSMLFFLLGFFVIFNSARYADKLSSSECNHLESDLVMYSNEAVEFHAKCTAGTPEGEFVLITACQGYNDMVEVNPERAEAWAFLQQMENDFYCAGFCSIRTRPLWTFSTSKVEPCNLPIAMKLKSYTRQTAVQVTAYSAAVICMFGLWIVLLWPSVKYNSYARTAAPAEPMYYAEGGMAPQRL